MDFKISNSYLSCKTSSDTDIIDITPLVSRRVAESGLTEGQVLIFVPGSTAAVTTIEYESGVVWDLKEAIERIAPTGIPYRHDAKWGDGNGYAHVRAALLGPSLTVPLIKSRLALGTWQQIVLVDFDNEPRDRKVLVSISGSSSPLKEFVSKEQYCGVCNNSINQEASRWQKKFWCF